MENYEDEFEAVKSFPKGNPFDVPENYFEEFPTKIEVLINKRAAPSLNTITKFSRPTVLLAIAAMVAIICMIGFNLLIPNNQELTTEEISEYLNQEGIIDELTITEIISYSSSNSVDTLITQTSNNMDEINTIEAILLDEDVELNEIINTF